MYLKKKNIYIYKMVLFEIFKVKFDPNIHQIAPFKKKFRGTCPQNPLAKRILFKYKTIILAPPPS